MFTHKITISTEVHEKFPGLRVFMFCVTNLRIARGKADVTGHVAAAVAGLNRRELTIERLAQSEPITSWRTLFSGMKLQPSTYRSSVEALIRRALRDGSLPTTEIEIVDLYNSISVSHLVPMGAYDIAKIRGNIDVRFARTTDEFTPLGGKKADFPIKSTVIVYAVADEVLCFGVNCRDSNFTSVNNDTNHAIFCAEALNDQQAQSAISALSSLAQALRAAGALTGRPVEAKADCGAVSLNGSNASDEWDETLCGSGSSLRLFPAQS
jgi:DNA/RNA-binding domain of Phe-tRNA-synthetase-like protein